MSSSVDSVSVGPRMRNWVFRSRPIRVRFSAAEPSGATFQTSYLSDRSRNFSSDVHWAGRYGGGVLGESNSSLKNFTGSLPVRFLVVLSATLMTVQSFPSNRVRYLPEGDGAGTPSVAWRSTFFSPVRT